MPTSSSPDVRAALRRSLEACAYPGYVYGYPHKKAYRPLGRPRPLEEVWRDEGRENLLCYVHIPFCGQRCGFCNLFTYVPGNEPPASAYLDALGREMAATARALGDFRFTRLYVGGGTPTYLDAGELRRLVALLRQELGVEPAAEEGCVEASPETLDAEKTAVLREAGFRRVSLGVQSLVEEELRQVNRRFDFRLHDAAIRLIGGAGFAHFNIDLIYGLPGQTAASWAWSLDRAIDSPATSLFLYPLYVRPLTGLAVRQRAAPDHPTTRAMAAMYDHAVDRLGRAGFRQWTMRQFRRDREEAPGEREYRCQEHGTVGLGAGARSYTAGLHYSTPWRMAARNIRAVVGEYQERMRQGDFRVAHGFVLDADERMRRYVIASLLYDGLDAADFGRAFGAEVRQVFGEVLAALADENCTRDEGGRVVLTERGVRHADVVGQLFFSRRVRQLVEEYEYDV
jgi:oxygen-independent coproporphyrinogen-3 oxidase